MTVISGLQFWMCGNPRGYTATLSCEVNQTKAIAEIMLWGLSLI